MKTHLMIGTPAYQGLYQHEYLEGLLDLAKSAACLGIELTWKAIPNLSLLTVARNTIAADFMKSSASHLLFVDADVGFSAKDVVQLLDAGRDVIGADYPHKVHGKQSSNYIALGPVDENGIVEVYQARTGFLLISRRVFAKISESRFDLKCKAYAGLTSDESYFRFFQFEGVNRFGYEQSEDFFFCDLWRSVGGKVFLDTRLKPSHTGRHVFNFE